MRDDEFLRALSSLEGVVRAERMDAGLLRKIEGIELGMGRGASGIRIENRGMAKCSSREDVFVLICDGRLQRPSGHMMEMVDDDGVVVGHNVSPGDPDPSAGGEPVQWLTSSFVMYPGRMALRDVRMVMRAGRLPMRLPDGVDAWVFYPSVSSAGEMLSHLGVEDRALCAVVLGVDGLERPASVPVADVVEVPCAGRGHGEPAAEDALYRCDLVGERLEVAELALADEDLHALVMVQVHVHRGVDHALVVVLDVGQLVPDGGYGVVVHHDDGPDHPLVLVLPLRLGQGVAHQVPDRLGPAHVPLLRYGFVELLEKFRLKRNTDASHSVHGGPSNPVAKR